LCRLIIGHPERQFRKALCFSAVVFKKQESRAAARKPRDAASVFSVEVRQQLSLYKLDSQASKAATLKLQTCWRKTQFNTKSGFKVNQSHVFGVSGKTVRQ